MKGIYTKYKFLATRKRSKRWTIRDNDNNDEKAKRKRGAKR